MEKYSEKVTLIWSFICLYVGQKQMLRICEGLHTFMNLKKEAWN